MCGVHRPPRGVHGCDAPWRRPRADARRVTMLRSLTHVGEGTERRAPRRPSRCTAPEARRAQDGELPYRAEPARLTREALYVTRAEGGGGRHPPPFVLSLQWGKWHRESAIGKPSSGRVSIGNLSSGRGNVGKGIIGGGQYREGQYRGRLKARGTRLDQWNI